MNLPKADALALAAVAFAAISGLTITLSEPFVAVDTEPVFSFDNPQQEELFHWVETEFGLFTDPRLSADWLAHGSGQLQRGRTIYQVQCLHCHGSEGGAETPTARLLTPPPRNFSLGFVRISSTPSGSPPRREDLRRTVHDGIPNTSMSSFSKLPEADRNAAVDYVMYLLIRGSVWNQALALLPSTSPAEAFSVAKKAQQARWSRVENR